MKQRITCGRETEHTEGALGLEEGILVGHFAEVIVKMKTHITGCRGATSSAGGGRRLSTGCMSIKQPVACMQETEHTGSVGFEGGRVVGYCAAVTAEKKTYGSCGASWGPTSHAVGGRPIGTIGNKHDSPSRYLHCLKGR